MSGNLQGRLAIVTGATGGLGRMIAQRLAESGAVVVIGYLRNGKAAADIVKEIQASGGDALTAQCDIADVHSLKRELDVIARSRGVVDILVNNAGVLPRPSSWQTIDEQSWHTSVDVNLRGTFNCIRWAHPYLSKSEHASIVNLSSTTGTMLASPGAVAYGASKAGVISLTRTMAKALAPRIRVNAVCPGFIDAGITNSSSPSFLAEQCQKILIGRLGTAAEVAASVVFLASDAASYITGQILTVDGGHSIN